MLDGQLGGSFLSNKSAIGPMPENQNSNFEVIQPPDDTVSALAFCPAMQKNFLIAGSWDNSVSCRTLGHPQKFELHLAVS